MVSAQKPSGTGQAGSRAGEGGLSRMDVFICDIPAHLHPWTRRPGSLWDGPKEGKPQGPVILLHIC